MAREPVAIRAALALVLPFLLVAFLDVVVMDREKQIGSERVGARDPLEQLRPGGARGDEKMGLAKARVDQRLFHLLRQAKIEHVFLDPARTGRALPFRRMADVEHELEAFGGADGLRPRGDRKSTRLNSSHVAISYA